MPKAQKEKANEGVYTGVPRPHWVSGQDTGSRAKSVTEKFVKIRVVGTQSLERGRD